MEKAKSARIILRRGKWRVYKGGRQLPSASFGLFEEAAIYAKEIAVNVYVTDRTTENLLKRWFNG